MVMPASESCFPQKTSVVSEALVERMLQEKAPFHEKIRRMEVAIGIFRPVFDLVTLSSGHFIAIAQVRVHTFMVVARHGVTAINRRFFGRQIGFHEVVARNAHTTIDKEQPLEPSLSRQQVSDGSPSDVFVSTDVAAGANGGALAVARGDFSVVGTVVADENLELQTIDFEGLSRQFHHRVAAVVVERWHQNRKLLSHLSFSFKNCAVILFFCPATCSGVPSQTSSPPLLPPSGPRSMT